MNLSTEEYFRISYAFCSHLIGPWTAVKTKYFKVNKNFKIIGDLTLNRKDIELLYHSFMYSIVSLVLVTVRNRQISLS